MEIRVTSGYLILLTFRCVENKRIKIDVGDERTVGGVKEKCLMLMFDGSYVGDSDDFHFRKNFIIKMDDLRTIGSYKLKKWDIIWLCYWPNVAKYHR